MGQHEIPETKNVNGFSFIVIVSYLHSDFCSWWEELNGSKGLASIFLSLQEVNNLWICAGGGHVRLRDAMQIGYFNPKTISEK